MGSCLVEVAHIGMEHALELLLVEDQQMVEAFLSDAPQEALADRIGSGCMNRRLENLNATGCRHASKARPEFVIVITNQVLGCLSIGRGFSQLLRHPGIGRRACHSDMDHPSGLEFNEEEGKERSKEEIGDHFVRPHASLRVALVQPQAQGGKRLARRYRQRTPAMAAGRTNRRWTAREVLSCPLPPVSA